MTYFQMGITRDVGIIDCYRYYEGAQYKDSFPIVVTFKARREKEQMLWRSKDKLRKQVGLPLSSVFTFKICKKRKISIKMDGEHT